MSGVGAPAAGWRTPLAKACSRFALLASLGLTATAIGAAPRSQNHAPPSHSPALERLGADHRQFVADIVTINEIPAPTFAEGERARAFAEMLGKAGLHDVRIDTAGNVIGIRKGAKPQIVAISAHLDTVFPIGTPVKVRVAGTRLRAPGVADDALGLAALLSYARALTAANVRTRDTIMFVATVGEEGAGNLRGVRHLFQNEPIGKRIRAFISVDGIDPSIIVTRAVGSKRYRINFSGPGGHSYDDFGIVNPIGAAARTVLGISKMELPTEPKATVSANLISGGMSVNSIPREAALEIDIRSESPDALRRLDEELRSLVRVAVSQENETASLQSGAITAKIEMTGDRPAGRTDAEGPLVKNAIQAARILGFAARLEASSTDANIPMSLGIPAITIGAGGGGGRAHSLEEYIDVAQPASSNGLAFGFLTLLAEAGAL